MLPDRKHIAPSVGHRKKRWLKIVLWSVFGFIAAVVLGITALTLYLSDGRLAEIFRRRSSEYFDADVSVSKMDFSIWSTFPHLCIEVDSLDVVSRTLHKPIVPAAALRELPSNSDSLLRVERMKGSIDVMELLRGRIDLKNIELDGLNMNLVVLNDSVNNYSIIPSQPDTKVHIPYFTADSVTIRNIRNVTFWSAPYQLAASADLGDISLLRDKKDHDNYHLDVKGKLDARFKVSELCNDLPFDFNGDVRFGFDPFKLVLSDMRIGLANIRSKVSLDMDFGDETAINSLTGTISPFELMKLLTFIPSRILPDLSGLESDVTAQISITLTKPYSFSSAGLPSFETRFAIPPSKVYYTLADGQEYRVDNLELEGRFIFDGDDYNRSYCNIDRLSAVGEGLMLILRGRVDDVFSDPLLAANLSLHASLPKVSRLIEGAGKFRISGEAEMRAGVNADIGNLVAGNLNGLRVKGKVKLHPTEASIPGVGVIGIDGAVADLDYRDGGTAAVMNVDNVHYSHSAVKGLKSGAASNLKVNYSPENLSANLGKAVVILPDGTVITGLNLKLQHPDDATWIVGAETLKTNLAVNDKPSDNVAVTASGTTAKIGTGEGAANYITLTSNRISGATMMFPAGVVISNLDAGWIGGDSLVLRSLKVRSQHTAFALTGNMKKCQREGKPFYCINANFDADTLHLNQIAHTLQSGSAKVEKRHAIPTHPIHAFLTPDNIDLHVNARAKATVYTNLWLDSLSAVLNMQPHRLDLDTLGLAANFGKVAMSAHYTCPDSLNLKANFDASMTDFDLTRFFNSYPNVLAMMPQMKNLHGVFTASLDAGCNIFRDMNVEIPSLRADIDVTGENLYIHQSPFIRNLAHMLLIRRPGDIYMPNINAHARVFDELLEVEPVEITVDKYRLIMTGRNDFAGDLYYHLDVAHNPFLPFRFGINIGGMFHSPKLRFAKGAWDSDKALKIDRINNDMPINVVTKLRALGVMLIHHASESDTIPQANNR